MGPKAVKVEGISATTCNAAKYPISRKLSLYTAGKTEPHVSQFIEWIQNDTKAREVIERVGFTPLSKGKGIPSTGGEEANSISPNVICFSDRLHCGDWIILVLR